MPKSEGNRRRFRGTEADLAEGQMGSVIAGTSVASLLALLGCAPMAPAETSAENSGDGSRPHARSDNDDEGEGPSNASVDDSPHPLSDDRPADPSRSLPELTYSHLGMHIGGEPNDADSKRPWIQAIDDGSDGLLRCYRFVDDPFAGGSFGVDLYVSTKGGAPEVRATRQKIGGEAFESCMKEAFTRLSFQAPERPTVLSYSILFRMEPAD